MSKLDELIKDINKQYKEEIAFKGNDSNLYKYELVPFSSPRLNYMLYGGLPMGRMIEFAGAEKSGKTTTALDMVKNCQKKFEEEYEFAKKRFPENEIIKTICKIQKVLRRFKYNRKKSLLRRCRKYIRCRMG